MKFDMGSDDDDDDDDSNENRPDNNNKAKFLCVINTKPRRI
jgi:hypothetical protein